MRLRADAKEAGQTFNAAQKASGRQKNDQMAKACVSARSASDMFLLTQTNMTQGGSVDPNTARQLLGDMFSKHGIGPS